MYRLEPVVIPALLAYRSSQSVGWSRNLEIPGQARDDRVDSLTPEAQLQWRLYSKTFGIVFQMFDGQDGRPGLEECFREVALKLHKIKNESELYSMIFAELRAHPEYQAAELSYLSKEKSFRINRLLQM